ncbi:MAG: hypothetical protein PUD16_07145 [bacterium]|nr:hypothetical protein [bacterium]
MKTYWLLYEDCDFAINQGFARMMQESGKRFGVSVEPVLLSQLHLSMDGQGQPFCLKDGKRSQPDAVLSRQRYAWISEHFERMGVVVYNNARVCRICNDKRITHQFLQGLPMPPSVFFSPVLPQPPQTYPVLIKPACSHGGDRVTLVSSEAEWYETVQRIQPEPMLQQTVVSDAGCDLRVYVLHGKILAGVMRTAQSGVVSNFKKGGHVALHELTDEERSLAEAVIRRFDEAGAPLHMAGVDMLYHHGHPVIGEVEDVVGSRMLYQTSNLDIVTLYLEGLAAKQQ